MKSYVYLHIRLDKNEVFYVGIGTMGKGDVQKRRSKCVIKRNAIWQKIVNKTNYSIVIFKDNISRDEACNIEIELIEKYGRISLKTGTLANIVEGGGGILGYNHTDETRAKMKGRKMSPEAISKMVAKTTGLKRDEKFKETIRAAQIGNKNGLGKRKPEFGEAVRLRNTGRSMPKGYSERQSQRRTGVKIKTHGEVSAYKKGSNEFVGTFRGVFEAAEFLKCHPQLISKILAGNDKRYSTNGFIFKRVA